MANLSAVKLSCFDSRRRQSDPRDRSHCRKGEIDEWCHQFRDRKCEGNGCYN